MMFQNSDVNSWGNGRWQGHRNYQNYIRRVLVFGESTGNPAVARTVDNYGSLMTVASVILLESATISGKRSHSMQDVRDAYPAGHFRIFYCPWKTEAEDHLLVPVNTTILDSALSGFVTSISGLKMSDNVWYGSVTNSSSCFEVRVGFRYGADPKEPWTPYC